MEANEMPQKTLFSWCSCRVYFPFVWTQLCQSKNYLFYLCFSKKQQHYQL